MQRIQDVKSQPKPDMEALNYFQSLADIEAREMGDSYQTDKEVGMMVSLSHSIYFHHPTAVNADDWLLSEMESPWAGDGRGMVVSRWWSSDGVLLATCVQEVSDFLFRIKVLITDISIIGCYETEGRGDLVEVEAGKTMIQYIYIFLLLLWFWDRGLIIRSLNYIQASRKS